MPKDSIRTRAVTFDTAKHFIIPIETLCWKDLPFLFIRQHKLCNETQLRIASVTRFIWYFAKNTTVAYFLLCGLIENIEHSLSLKF